MWSTNSFAIAGLCITNCLTNFLPLTKNQMVTYEFLQDGKFAVMKLSGNIDKESLLSFLGLLFRREEIPGVKIALLDYRDDLLKIPIAEVNDIVKYRLERGSVLKNIKTVHLVNTSYETAFTVLYTQQIPGEIADTAVCSTLSRAIQLLDIDFTEAELEEHLRNLAFRC